MSYTTYKYYKDQFTTTSKVKLIIQILDNYSEKCISLYCHLNNYITKMAFHKEKAKRAMILLPYCIQKHSCYAKITNNMFNCYLCNSCEIAKIINTKLYKKCQYSINNRSHQTYEMIHKYKPDLIIAISCIDRLTKGLIELPDTPSYIIPLSTQNGMCFNTNLPIKDIIKVITMLVD